MSLAERLGLTAPPPEDPHSCDLCSHPDYVEHKQYVDRLVLQNERLLKNLARTSKELAELRRLKTVLSEALHENSRLVEAIVAPIDTTQVTARDHGGMRSAMWVAHRTVQGFDVVSDSDLNRARAYDYVVERLEGAGIQVRAERRSFGGGDLGIEFRGEEATIVAPLTSTSWGLIRIAFHDEEPDPEHILVKLFFGPRNEYAYEGPRLHSVTGSVGDVIALIQY
jgi:hypothetical protein